MKDGDGWRFDTAAGTEEVLARRIGRNELAAILVCRTYIKAQNVYAVHGHDGQPAGCSPNVKSDDGEENGLYWPACAAESESPLGDLVACAAQEGRSSRGDGNAFPRLLLPDGEPRRPPFPALVAWPAQYDATGVMTFMVGPMGRFCKRISAPTRPAR